MRLAWRPILSLTLPSEKLVSLTEKCGDCCCGSVVPLSGPDGSVCTPSLGFSRFFFSSSSSLLPPTPSLSRSAGGAFAGRGGGVEDPPCVL